MWRISTSTRTHFTQIWFIYLTWVPDFLARKIHDELHEFLRNISCIFCDKKFHRLEFVFTFRRKMLFDILNLKTEIQFEFSVLAIPFQPQFLHFLIIAHLYNGIPLVECCTNIQTLRKSSRRQNFIILSKVHETSNSSRKNGCLRAFTRINLCLRDYTYINKSYWLE